MVEYSRVLTYLSYLMTDIFVRSDHESPSPHLLVLLIHSCFILRHSKTIKASELRASGFPFSLFPSFTLSLFFHLSGHFTASDESQSGHRKGVCLFAIGLATLVVVVIGISLHTSQPTFSPIMLANSANLASFRQRSVSNPIVLMLLPCFHLTSHNPSDH